MPPDPRPPARVRNPDLMRRLHGEWRDCALRDDMHPDTPFLSGAFGLSLHHIHKHPRDDVQANLMMTCGSGTTGCHGLIEHHDATVMVALQRAISERVDTRRYLVDKLGGPEAASEWIARLTQSRTGGSAA